MPYGRATLATQPSPKPHLSLLAAITLRFSVKFPYLFLLIDCSDGHKITPLNLYFEQNAIVSAIDTAYLEVTCRLLHATLGPIARFTLRRSSHRPNGAARHQVNLKKLAVICASHSHLSDIK